MLALLVSLLALACADSQRGGEEVRPVTLAATTTIEDSGLLAELTSAFRAARPATRLRTLVVGTGEALQLGRRGDVDVLLTHDPAAESTFVAEGYGTGRREVMYNDFVLVGPASDPAGIRGMKDAAAALRRIAEDAARFVSRGDDSGTHRKEVSLWRDGGREDPPSFDGYVEAGLGMGDALRVADERDAYILTDRATFQTLRDGLDLQVMLQGDPRLSNPYGVVPVAGARNPEGARDFAAWVTSPEGQAVIGRFGLDRFGEPLFHPSARAGG